MSKLLCIICDRTDTCDRFLSQHCGHVFCEDCISQISSDRVANEPRCPTCRAEWGSRSPFRIYLNFADADKSSRLYDRLENISEDTPSIFVEKAGGIIKELVNDPGTALSDDQTVALLDAAGRLEQRVAPLISELERSREENLLLQSQLNSIHLELKSKESLTTEIDRMNRTIMERDMNLISIRDELTHEKQKRNSEQETNRRLTRSLRKKQEEIKTKEKEIEGLRTEIQERDKRLGLQKAKLRALTKRTKAPEMTVQNPDDSLIVEQPLIDIENDGSFRGSQKPGSISTSRPLSALFSISKRRKTHT